MACPPLFTYLCLIGTARAWESEGGYWQAGRSRVKPELWAPPRDGWRLRKQSSAPVCTSIPVTVAFIELLAVACCRRLSALLSHRTVAKAVPGAKTRDSLPAGGRFPTGGGGGPPFLPALARALAAARAVPQALIAGVFLAVGLQSARLHFLRIPQERVCWKL